MVIFRAMKILKHLPALLVAVSFSACAGMHDKSSCHRKTKACCAKAEKMGTACCATDGKPCPHGQKQH